MIANSRAATTPVPTASAALLRRANLRNRYAAEGGQAYWIWAAMDNLVRGGALNAIEAAEALLRAGRPS